MSWSRRFASAIALAACSACAPLNPSMHDVTGRWEVECADGKETLDLRADGRYTYTVESPHRHARVDGAWSIEPARERLAGARIILRNALQICENADAFTDTSTPAITTLAPVWEWGHTELSYHPDLGGFRRVDSSR